MGSLENVGVLVVVVLLAVIIVVSFVSGGDDATAPGQGAGSASVAPAGGVDPALASNLRRAPDPVGEGRMRIVSDEPRTIPTVSPKPADDAGSPGPKSGEPKAGLRPVEVVKPGPPGSSSGKGGAELPAAGSGAGFPRKVRIRDGDSTWRIAKRVYGSDRLAELMAPVILEANGITDPRRLVVGQELTLPAPTAKALAAEAGARATKGERPAGAADKARPATLPFAPDPQPWSGSGTSSSSDGYVVQPGDLLGAIALRECGSVKFVDEIVRLNGIKDANAIRPGMVLKLPPKQP